MPLVEPLGPRPHRRITGPSGLLLALCAFLPCLPHCRAADVPVLWPPHIYGLLIALAAAAYTQRGMRLGLVAMRVVTWVVFSVAILLAIVFLPYSMMLAAPASLVLAAHGSHGSSERRAASCAVAVGGLGTVWFGLMSMAPRALFGAHLALVASIGLFVGGMMWLRDCERDLPRVPEAVARRRA